FGQLALACRSAHETDPGRALENVFTFLLSQAAENADDFIFRDSTPFAEARKDFLRRFFADAASVVQHKVRFRRIRRGRVSTIKQHARHFFGIMHVHLAAEGFDEKALTSSCTGSSAA